MTLLDQRRLDRILKRMAYQIIEKSKGYSVDMIGLNERGYAVGSRIASIIEENTDCTATLQSLRVEEDEALSTHTRKNKHLFIVDDVVYSGATMFRALTSIPGLEEYDSVTVVAVVDRGHRKLPIGADIVGVTVPTKVNEHVEFELKNSHPNQVLLTKI